MSDHSLTDLMVPADEYASVSAEASIRDGVRALKQAQLREIHDHPERHRDRAVLVRGPQGEILGKLSMWSIIGCMEPKYDRRLSGSASSKAASRMGTAHARIKDTFDTSHRWRSRLGTIAGEVAHLKIKDLMHAPRAKELIDEKASLETAIHQLVSDHLMSLLVTREGRIIGVLRLIDVFEAVCDVFGCDDHRAEAGDRASQAD